MNFETFVVGLNDIKHSRGYAFNYLIDIIKTILLRHNISIC